MGWATEHIANLKAGETVSFRAKELSMKGRIESGALVTVEPVIDNKSIKIDDVVLCVVRDNQYLHIVKDKKGGQCQIGNNHGFINGWTSHIYGKVVKIE